jgi:hypothetical protein
MLMNNCITFYGVKYLFQKTYRKIRFCGRVGLCTVGLGPLVFWLSCRLVELSFGRAGFGRVDGLPQY